MSGVKELVHVEGVITQGENFTLQLSDGREVACILGVTRTAIFPFEVEDGLTVIAYEWGRPAAECFAVPMQLSPILRPYFTVNSRRRQREGVQPFPRAA